MKKLFIFSFIFIMIISFVSCDFIVKSTTSNQINSVESTTVRETTTENQSTTAEISTVLTTTIEPNITSIITTVLNTSTVITTTNALTSETTTEQIINEPLIPNGYATLQDELETVGIPAIGDVRILVFVVDFPDKLISNTAQVLANTELAFNGESQDLTYESLSSYYLKSSYNQLNITADIYGVYTTSLNASDYEIANDEFYATDPITGEYLYPNATHPDSDIIFEVLSYYDDVIDYSDYDSNNDGFIDGIYIMYNHEISYVSGSDLWWAYQYYYYYYDSFDGVAPNYYVWAGIDFFNEGDEGINAKTIIHETGHMLGLEDYYDYYPDDAVNSGGLGTFMMDYTIGDHDAFSKILLGWITPIVIEASMEVEIAPHLENGDVLLIIDEWKNTIFDEYLLVMYYTPDGLNELDSEFMFTVAGILIFHISAKIDDGYNQNYYYYSIFNNNNTDSPNKLIKIIEADMGNDIDKYAIVENSDLFKAGMIFNDSIYTNYRWYTGSLINFYINVVTINESSATIEINFY